MAARVANILWLLALGLLPVALGAKNGGGVDTFTALSERDWFVAHDHQESIRSYVAGWTGQQTLHALDLFGGSRGVERAFQRRGYQAAALDFQIGGLAHDVLSRQGWFLWLDHLLMMRDGGLCVCGPPCSLWIFMSAGTYKRHGVAGIWGDLSLKCVRMSNLIIKNFATMLQQIHPVRQLYYVIEQPTSSVMYDTEEFALLKQVLMLSMVTTWLGLYGHVLHKGAKLLTNLPQGAKLKRKMTQQGRDMIQRRFERALRKAERNGETLCFYRKDKKGRVSGGKDLPGTAAYPKAFCDKIFELWAKTLPADRAVPAVPMDQPEIIVIDE